MMLDILAYIIVFIFCLLSLIHIYWALGGERFGKNAVPLKEDGSAVFHPGKAPTFVVAVGLLLFAATILGNTDVLGKSIPESMIRIGTMLIAGIFTLRAIGEFRYVGLFRRIRKTDFARKDAQVYTPLCLLIAVACWIIAL